MFRGDGELTMKLFNLCGLNDVINLRQACKTIYRMSNTQNLDNHYWKGELIRMFGGGSCLEDCSVILVGRVEFLDLAIKNICIFIQSLKTSTFMGCATMKSARS
jgi:hypothetical protein